MTIAILEADDLFTHDKTALCRGDGPFAVVRMEEVEQGSPDQGAVRRRSRRLRGCGKGIVGAITVVWSRLRAGLYR